MKKLCLILPFFILLLFGSNASAQDFLGYSNSNYAGVSGIDLNPASIADSRFKFDMTLIGFNVNIANNYLGLNQAGKEFIMSGDTSAFDNKKYLVERTNSDRKSVFLSQQLQVPSFMITLTPKDAIGITIRERALLNIDGVEQYLAHQMYKGLKDSSTFKMQFDNKNFGVGTMEWLEYGATYARVLINEKEHFIKAGAHVKYLQGIAASYLFIKDFNYNVTSDTTIDINASASYGHSNSFSLDQGMTTLKASSKPSFGFDLGVIYEWRPDHEKYYYDMDGKTHLPMRYMNKYKLRAGLSVVDIGKIKFDKTDVGNFNMNLTNFYYSNWKASPGQTPIESLDSLFRTKGTIVEGNAPFKMQLPTTISTQVDYNIWKDFYANFTAYYAFQFSKKDTKVHEMTNFSISPRWDWKWFGVFVPVSYNSYQKLHTGLDLRLGPLILGTSNLSPILGKKDVYGADFHFILKLFFLRFHKPKDKDGDHVSNKKDKCKDVPGTWEFSGCPDRDGDHIPDNLDECPDVAGAPKFNGCPDKDGDEIVDKKDSCPDVAGLLELNGCPDKDGDKITDKKDSCPDEAGLAEYMGCPDRDHDRVIDKNDLCPDDSGSVETFGCPDRDGDEIVDKVDRCPDKPGPKENDGCPLARLHLLDKQGNIIATATIDKEGKFHFTELPIDEHVLLNLESYDVLIVNEVTVGSGKTFRIARRGADGFFHFETLTTEQNKLGQLDIPDVQIQLKKEEAEKVMKAMTSLEFDFGKDVIRTSSMDGLDLLAELLQQNPTWRLKLSGHTDNVASMQFNMKLSEKRVESVKNYLSKKKGIAPDRIVLKWYGPTQPIAPNTTEDGKQKNRRVEFLIIK